MSATILIVDDCADFRAAVRLALESAGYTVLEACDGFECLAIVKAKTEVRFDLILIDVQMPGMSGAQLVDELRRCEDLPPFGLIAVSGSVGARSSPTKWFLSKPVPLDLLLGVVGDFCGRRSTSPLWVREQRSACLDAIEGLSVPA